MIVAVVGCLHGELEFLYEELGQWEKQTGKKVDFIVCSGDFQVWFSRFIVVVESPDQGRPGCAGMPSEVQDHGLVPSLLYSGKESPHIDTICWREP
jgi:hypothetical protein